MPSQTDVEDFVRARLKQRTSATVERSTNLVTSGVIDSFALLELVSELEEHFGVEIDVTAYDFEVFATLGGLCDAAVASG